tara:strand:+ start:122 stop:508 length:387 start_codon:yes stop_codon:yes gene_type:complete
MKKLISISEVSRTLNLVNQSTKKPLNHILRFWEKEFKEIRPKKINNRRYYSPDQVEIIKMIKFLLKNKGMTILGVKNLLTSKTNRLDDHNMNSLKAEHYKKNLVTKSKLLLNKINKIKNYGKKNTSQG